MKGAPISTYPLFNLFSKNVFFKKDTFLYRRGMVLHIHHRTPLMTTELKRRRKNVTASEEDGNCSQRCNKTIITNSIFCEAWVVMCSAATWRKFLLLSMGFFLLWDIVFSVCSGHAKCGASWRGSVSKERMM